MRSVVLIILLLLLLSYMLAFPDYLLYLFFRYQRNFSLHNPLAPFQTIAADITFFPFSINSFLYHQCQTLSLSSYSFYRWGYFLFRATLLKVTAFLALLSTRYYNGFWQETRAIKIWKLGTPECWMLSDLWKTRQSFLFWENVRYLILRF